jgi:hypothetical protein
VGEKYSAVRNGRASISVYVSSIANPGVLDNSHLISSHLISSHLISSHLISSHLISPNSDVVIGAFPIANETQGSHTRTQLILCTFAVKIIKKTVKVAVRSVPVSNMLPRKRMESEFNSKYVTRDLGLVDFEWVLRIFRMPHGAPIPASRRPFNF